MKKAALFALYAVLLFALVFGILYGGEIWVFHRGKPVGSILVESGVAAAVFTIFLAMVAHRSEMRDERWKREREERRNRLDQNRKRPRTPCRRNTDTASTGAAGASRPS